MRVRSHVPGAEPGRRLASRAGHVVCREAAIEAHLQLRPVPTSAGVARHFIDTTLTGWGCHGLVDSVTLLVSEVVTNAILHARSDIELHVFSRGRVLRVEVRDHERGEPLLRPHADTSTSGRGMAIVEQVASSWGVTQLPDGKLVWFEVD